MEILNSSLVLIFSIGCALVVASLAIRTSRSSSNKCYSRLHSLEEANRELTISLKEAVDKVSFYKRQVGHKEKLIMSLQESVETAQLQADAWKINHDMLMAYANNFVNTTADKHGLDLVGLRRDWDAVTNGRELFPKISLEEDEAS